jgi:hypothetical protein
MRRLLCAAVVTLSAGAAPGVAGAAVPTHVDISRTGETIATTLCAFPVTVDSTQEARATFFFDQSGTLVSAHAAGTETDTFSANGKTLVGTPYHLSVTENYDAAGNIISSFGNGVAERIRLPDGTLFLAAGRVDFTAHPEGFVLTPDFGHSGDMSAFCAALEA